MVWIKQISEQVEEHDEKKDRKKIIYIGARYLILILGFEIAMWTKHYYSYSDVSAESELKYHNCEN